MESFEVTAETIILAALEAAIDTVIANLVQAGLSDDAIQTAFHQAAIKVVEMSTAIDPLPMETDNPTSPGILRRLTAARQGIADDI